MALPCKNKHSDMEKKEKGYHCKSCDHVLTDFRNSTHEEIRTALETSPGKICGVFYPSQFDYKVSQVNIPAFRAVGLSLLGILGFLGPVITSCESTPAATEHKQNAFNLLKFPMHVKGSVKDEKTGKPLPYFKVEVLQHGKVIKTVKTDGQGDFDAVIYEKDLDEEVFNLAIGGNGFENDTISSNISKFRNKKVKLTIKAEAVATVNTLGIPGPKIMQSCTTVEGEIMSTETVDGIPRMEPIEPPKQIPELPAIDELVGVIVQTEAEFPGGQRELANYLSKKLVYPADALKNNIGGRVYLRFMILEDGSISKVKVQRGIPDCKECDDEAVRVIEAMPKWKPAQENGKAVSSWYNIPIKFNP